MRKKTPWKSFLKDACRLTGAAWAAVLARRYETWQLETGFNLSRDENTSVSLLLQNGNFLISLQKGIIAKRPYRIPVATQSGLRCEYIYVFATSGETCVIVGASNDFTSQNQGIWKLAVHMEDSAEAKPTNAEVGLLQHNLMELQQTQQELQARISAQREAEARLIQAAKLAAVGEMAAGVAHELNNPLTSVVGFTELALDELPSDVTVRGDLELVLKEARRARSVVRRLLDFARQAETIRVKADLNEIVDDMLVLTKHLMQTNNVQPLVKLGSNLSWVSVDRNQIKQVVINLVNNALYAMPGGGQLEIETAEQDRFGRSWLTLSIRDNGIGISPENLERIFEPFFTTRGDRGGTGLGLSVTYGIVTDHGGMIEVESQLHVGSVFVVWLPLDQNT